MFRHAHESSRNLESVSKRVANSDIQPELSSPQFVCDWRGTRPPAALLDRNISDSRLFDYFHLTLRSRERLGKNYKQTSVTSICAVTYFQLQAKTKQPKENCTMSEQVPDKLEDTAKDGVIEGAKPVRPKKPAKGQLSEKEIRHCDITDMVQRRKIKNRPPRLPQRRRWRVLL